jgi:hypothetical protein
MGRSRLASAHVDPIDSAGRGGRGAIGCGEELGVSLPEPPILKLLSPDSPMAAAATPEMQAEPVGLDVPIPAVETALSPEQILERLTMASRRGRLAGFERKRGGTGLFSVAAFATPFDHVLVGELEPDAGGGEGLGRLVFRLRMLPRMPGIFLAVLAFSVWPGVYFTDEMVAQFLPGLWRPWVTYWWYLPLTVIPLPWVWRGLVRRSRASAHDSAHEMVRKIGAELGARVVERSAGGQ